MEKLEETKLLKFHSNTFEAVRKENGLDKPGILDQSIDILDLWQQKQVHFLKKDFSRDYLERTLLTSEGSVEAAKSKLDQMCTTRTLLSQYFDNFDVRSEISPYEEGLTHAILPELTSKHERVIFFRNTGFKANTLNPLLKHIIKVFEYLRACDYSLGYSIILDIRDMNIMEILPILNPIDIRNAISIILDGFGLKLKSLHMVTASKMVDALNNVFHQMISTKLTDGIFVHKDLVSVYEAFPKEMLPKDYGGSEKTLKELNGDLLQVLSSEENVAFLKDMAKAMTDEALRPKDTFNEQYMGVPGSFKSLVVD